MERPLTRHDKRQSKGEVRYECGTPRTEKSLRNVDLPPDLLEDLRRYMASLPDHAPERLLFATAADTPLDPKNVVRRVFNPALRRAGLRHMSWHTLRHTYASLQLESGANIKYLSERMGHSWVQITLDRYAHLLKSSHPAQAARLSALVFDTAPAPPSAGAIPGAAEVLPKSCNPGTVVLAEPGETVRNTAELDATPHLREASPVLRNTEHGGTPGECAEPSTNGLTMA